MGTPSFGSGEARRSGDDAVPGYLLSKVPPRSHCAEMSPPRSHRNKFGRRLENALETRAAQAIIAYLCSSLLTHANDEMVTFNQVVVGSSPTGLTNKINKLTRDALN
jgi:hypothetical protein